VNDFDDLQPDDIDIDCLGADDVDRDDLGDRSQPADTPPAPQLYYPTLEVFVHDYLIGTYRRHIDGRNRNWCPQWWCHAEAIARLEAMWRSFEHLRMEPATGTSVWFINHADPHMAALLDPDGPFKYCTPENGHAPRLPPLQVQRPPAGMFVPPAV